MWRASSITWASPSRERRRLPLPLFTQEYVHGLKVFTLRYFEALYGFLKPDSLLVLDNYERVAEDSSLHQVVSQGISVLPETIRVIVISRKGPGRTLPPSRQQTRYGGWDGTSCVSAWRMRESWCGMRQQGDISDDVLRRLHQRTEGWAEQ